MERYEFLFQNGRRPHFFFKMEDNLNFLQIEDNLNFLQMENDLNFKAVLSSWFNNNKIE